MIGKRRMWAQSSNGPDELDVETMMRALGGLHSGVVSLLVSPVGIGGSGGIQTTACISFTVLPGSALPSEVGVTGNWPCKGHKSFWGHVYALLHSLDFEIAKVYKNEKLWE